jgi:NitT/TauT family transport system substrate-binding protein
MHRRHIEGWSRREFLGLTLAGTAGLLGLRPAPVAAEPPPETTTIRLHRIRGICIAPQYVAEELLKAEGFTDVQYVADEDLAPYSLFAAERIDISMAFVAPFLVQLDAGLPLVFLAGIHAGCFELFGSERVRAIRDLKGMRVGVPALGSVGAHYVFIAAMAAYVGLDPRKDIHWVVHSVADSVQLLAEGKVDAFMGFPPEPQELRAKQMEHVHVVVNATQDRPWSQYFCCMVAGNRDFVRKHPVATKRALRAILKANQICALEPDRAARLLVDKGFTTSYDHALQALKDIPYAKWREYDPEDTVRFYALRLHEVGMIKSTPQKIIAEGTDWRFLNELRQELKG